MYQILWIKKELEEDNLKFTEFFGETTKLKTDS